jgi:hypothetical protein
MFRDFDFITSINFPEKAEYIEKMIPQNVENPITFAGSIEFNFRMQKDERGFDFPIPGIRTDRRIAYRIETKSELPFKAGDKIRFDLDDKRKFVITNIEYKIDKRNEEEYQFVSRDWPGLAGDAIRIKVITLE